jgi:hypothetical protein
VKEKNAAANVAPIAGPTMVNYANSLFTRIEYHYYQVMESPICSKHLSARIGRKISEEDLVDLMHVAEGVTKCLM